MYPATWSRVGYRRLLVVLMVVVLLGLAYRCHLDDSPAFSEERFDRITIGMTKDQVIAILGANPGDYRPLSWQRPDWFVSPSTTAAVLDKTLGHPRDPSSDNSKDISPHAWLGGPIRLEDGSERARWWGRRCGIEVFFDAQGVATYASFWTVNPPPPPPDFLRRVKWWFE